MTESADGVRRVVVVRHARAETFAPEDRQRQLTEQGLADAAEAGRWLGTRGFRVDSALVSTAVRARQTWAELSTAAGCSDVAASYDEALYSAGTDTVLECFRALPDSARTVVFVGHNPTAGMLVQVLADGSGDDGLLRELSSGFPPASIAVLAHDGPWGALDLGTARVVDARVVHHA